jgi:uncharacterized protein (DUF2147 family)
LLKSKSGAQGRGLCKLVSRVKHLTYSWRENIGSKTTIAIAMTSLKINFRIARITIWLSLILTVSGFEIRRPAQQVVGLWESEEKNLQIEMFEDNGNFAGRMVYFKCSTDSIMRTSVDSENPDKRLTNRKLLGLKLVDKLTYQGDNVWSNGKIYDPNSGHTFEARIQLTSANTAIVRGYWKFRWLGRSMIFNRIE